MYSSPCMLHFPPMTAAAEEGKHFKSKQIIIILVPWDSWLLAIIVLGWNTVFVAIFVLVWKTKPHGTVEIPLGWELGSIFPNSHEILGKPPYFSGSYFILHILLYTYIGIVLHKQTLLILTWGLVTPADVFICISVIGFCTCLSGVSFSVMWMGS